MASISGPKCSDLQSISPKLSRLRRAKGQLDYPFQNAPPPSVRDKRVPLCLPIGSIDPADGGCGGREMAAPPRAAGGATHHVYRFESRIGHAHRAHLTWRTWCRADRTDRPDRGTAHKRRQRRPADAQRTRTTTPGVRSHAARNSSHDNIRAHSMVFLNGRTRAHGSPPAWPSES